jgi:hypothetical protein
MDIADEIREAVVLAHQSEQEIVLGKDIPSDYKDTILGQLNKIKQYLIVPDHHLM